MDPVALDLQRNKSGVSKYSGQEEGFLRCQTPTSTVRLKVEGCRVKNGRSRIKSEEWVKGGEP